MTGGGKDGRLFLMDRDSVVPLQWGQATFMMNPPMPLKTCGGSANLSKHIHGSPVFWNRQGSAPRVFLWGENDHLRAFELCDVGGHWRYCDNQPSGLRPAALSAMTVPAGMPGGVLSLSVNPSVDEDKSGILWVNHPCFWNPAANDGNGECEICPDAVGCFPENGAYYCGTDAEVYVSPGILRAFNAYSGSHFPNPEVPMTEIWNSGRESTDAYDADGMGGRGWTANVLGAYPPAPPSLSYAKFTAPTVANGRVYVPTFANSTGHAAVIVYGLGYNPPPN